MVFAYALLAICPLSADAIHLPLGAAHMSLWVLPAGRLPDLDNKKPHYYKGYRHAYDRRQKVGKR